MPSHPSIAVLGFGSYYHNEVQRHSDASHARQEGACGIASTADVGTRPQELPGLFASLPRPSAAEAGEFAVDLDAAHDELDEAGGPSEEGRADRRR